MSNGSFEYSAINENQCPLVVKPNAVKAYLKSIKNELVALIKAVNHVLLRGITMLCRSNELGTGIPESEFLTTKNAKYREIGGSGIWMVHFCVISRLLRLTGWVDSSSWIGFAVNKPHRHCG